MEAEQEGALWGPVQAVCLTSNLDRFERRPNILNSPANWGGIDGVFRGEREGDIFLSLDTVMELLMMEGSEPVKSRTQPTKPSSL